MASPIDAVRAMHNAFRRDMASIDTAALAAARDEAEVTKTLERSSFLNEMLVWHAEGEEIAVFPILEEIAPMSTESYVQDHRGLDAAFEVLSGAIAVADPLETARATAACKFHLDLHLDKEDTHLYPLMRERVSPPEQSKAVGAMAEVVPRERFPEVVAWWFPLIDHDDRETMVRIWRMVMPTEGFVVAVRLVRQAVGDDWAELVRRIPELEA